jgi:GNAT superfamily N-acetyltransferase
VTSVRQATDGDVEGCVRVLAQLPGYFTADTHDKVRTSIPAHRGWVAVDDAEGDGVVGFVIAEQRYVRSAEITYAAVLPDRRHGGIGTALVQRALDELAREGVEVVEVKTLDASAEYEPYVATRAFWEARGFVQVDCIDPLPDWQPGNPAAIYVAALTSEGP